MAYALHENLHTQILQEAFADTYPGPLIPGKGGVSGWRSHIAPTEGAPQLDRQQEAWLVDTSRHINHILQSEAHHMRPGESNQYMTILKNTQEVNHGIIQSAEAIVHLQKLLRDWGQPDLEIACPPAGATPLARVIAQMGIRIDRIHSPDIKGAIRNETGHASFDRTTVAPIILDPNTLLVLYEDIEDSRATIGQLIAARIGQHDLNLQDDSDFLQACKQANILFLPVFTKRAPMHITTIDSLWANAKQTLLRKFTPISIPNVWAIGGRVMDYGWPVPGTGWLIRIGHSLAPLAYVEKYQQDNIQQLAMEIMTLQS